MNPTFTRRDMAGWCAGLATSAALMPVAFAADAPLIKRPIPHGGEMLPAMGVGTVGVFNTADLSGPTAVVKALLAGGASVIDTARSYGQSEATVGAVVETMRVRPKTFLATKLQRYARGDAEVQVETRESLAALRTDKIDLLMLHNVRDAGQSLASLNALKAKGVIRYTGITTTYKNDYDAVEAVIRREKPDFVELDYAIDNRSAEERLLPAARDAGSAVLIALPFGRGRVFRNVLSKPLPDFAAEIDAKSWAHFFLKFLLGHPTVTVPIPGTGNAAHMIDNLGGARGRVPDAAMRARMVQYIEAV